MQGIKIMFTKGANIILKKYSNSRAYDWD